MEKKSYFVGVDIGTSNVAMVVGSRIGDGPINIEDGVTRPINGGVVAGRIDNVQSVGAAIRAAKEELERELNIRINEAYAGLSGEFVHCAYYTDHVFVRDNVSNCITKEDVASLHERMNNVIADPSEEILERIPQNYVIDSSKEIADPIGSFGRNLSSTFMFILCQKNQLMRVKMAFHNAGLSLLGTYVNPAVLPSLVLTDEEKDEGVAIVDIGGGTTDVSIVRGGKLRYIASVPIGAQSINADMHTFGISDRNTEYFKRKYGSAVADMVPADATIPIQKAGQQSKKDFPQRNLVAIIEARLKDIAEFAWAEIKHAKMSTKIPCGLVLTGGSTVLENIDELFRRETGVPVRLSTVESGISDETKEKVSTYLQSAAVAVMLNGVKRGKCDVIELSPKVIAPQQPTSPTTITPQPILPKVGQNVAVENGDGTTGTPSDDNGDTTTPPTTSQQQQTPESEQKSEPKKEPKKEPKRGGFIKNISKLLDAVLGNDKDDVL